MASTVIDGTPLEWRFDHLSDDVKEFYVGELHLGQVIKVRSGINKFECWAANSSRQSSICPVKGFKTKEYAAIFLLKLHGYIKD